MDTQRIIKAESMRQAGNKILFDFQDFHQHCDAEIQRARDQANEHVGEAQKRAVSIENQAQSEGYKAGYAEGLKNANEEIQKRVDALAKEAIDHGLSDKMSVINSLVVAISEAKLRWLAHWECIAIEFSVLVAEKIIRSEIAHQPKVRSEMIRGVLEVISAEERVTVRLHPDDVKYFQEIQQSETSPFHRLMEFQSDPNLHPGDCLADMDFGVLDGRIETQLKRIQDELSPNAEDEDN